MSDQRTAVVGTSLVTIPGGNTQQRSAVHMALLMAETQTRADYETNPKLDWYSAYRNKLRYLGWDAVTPEQIHWPDESREQIVDTALQTIGAKGGDYYAVTTGIAFDQLKRDAGTLLHFEQRSREERRFQLVPCAAVKGGYVDMVLYHEVCETAQLSAGFLYRERKARKVRATLVRFNPRLFEQEYRSKVERALHSSFARYIRDVEI
ncbi:hypothetical protein ACQKPE_15430 [Pseudomonas sp. NPDC089554]|uniref:hypothetical protein n=1 Tax=Pseudomonas sp. NPDC089554 TaxID=3390653 RepID=UPI003CFE2DF2